jgi:hypothetical protein
MKKHGISRPAPQGKDETPESALPEDPYDCISGP